MQQPDVIVFLAVANMRNYTGLVQHVRSTFQHGRGSYV